MSHISDFSRRVLRQLAGGPIDTGPPTTDRRLLGHLPQTDSCWDADHRPIATGLPTTDRRMLGHLPETDSCSDADGRTTFSGPPTTDRRLLSRRLQIEGDWTTYTTDRRLLGYRPCTDRRVLGHWHRSTATELPTTDRQLLRGRRQTDSCWAIEHRPTAADRRRRNWQTGYARGKKLLNFLLKLTCKKYDGNDSQWQEVACSGRR